jgi:hypothetical protein
VCEFGSDGGADFWSITQPKARKEHRCNDCGATIGRGEVYERAWWVYEGEATSSKRCMACSHTNDDFANHHDAGTFPGGLVSVITECFVENFQGGGGWMRWGRQLVAMKRRRQAAQAVAP